MSTEDTAEYWLYPASPSEAENLLSQVFSLVQSLTKDYVWTRQNFNLRILPTEPGNWCLYGRTYYGENVMDEWLLVSLLYEITRKLDLVARILDSDGEILLIEAAEQLPRWAGEPDTGGGRVYIYRGSVHLLSVCDSPGSVSPAPAVTPPPHLCAQLVAEYPDLSRAQPGVQAVIRDKIRGLPWDSRDNHHVTNVELPRNVARLLNLNTAFLSCLVSAVCERDPADTRAARAMSRVGRGETVRCSVKMSRCLYARLHSSHVQPHRSSQWTGRSHQDTGFKLSLGLEILLARDEARKCKEGSSGGTQGRQWQQFKSRLADVGYFKEELEGSIKYRELEREANNFFLASSEETFIEDDLCLAYKGLNEKEFQDSDLKGAIVNPPVAKADSEDWLEITPDVLDKMLEAQFGVSQHKDNVNIPSEVNNFLNKMSDMAGVEHEPDQDDVRIDADNFVESMKNLLSKMENAGAGSSEYLGSDDDNEDEDLTDSGDEDPIMKDYMSKLDEELPKEEEDVDKPLNIDTKVLSNLLQSYSEELGHGPVSSLLQSIRINPGRKPSDLD